MATFKVDLDLSVVADAVEAGAHKGLDTALEYALTEANRKVPHQEGTLQRSGHTSVDRAKLRGAVAYDTPYAVRQHEDLTLRHEDGRQGKYLESALVDNQDTIRTILATALRAQLEG